jgi:hypothetical protein
MSPRLASPVSRVATELRLRPSASATAPAVDPGFAATYSTMRTDVPASLPGTAQRCVLTPLPTLATTARVGRSRNPVQCVERSLQLARFSRERPQLLKTSIDLLADRVDQVGHDANTSSADPSFRAIWRD